MRFVWVLYDNAWLNKLLCTFIRGKMALLLGLRGISGLFLGLFYLELGVGLGYEWICFKRDCYAVLGAGRELLAPNKIVEK